MVGILALTAKAAKAKGGNKPPNAPSKTGKPSGGNRGNNPPKSRPK